MPQHLCVVGLQWGDEGKGKIVDVLSESYDVIARFQGGANAGHTVKVDDRKYIFHQVPSGLIHGGKVGILGAGMVLDLKVLHEELKQLEGIDYELVIDGRAHIVLPYHRSQDASQEQRGGVGSTRRGISQAYRDKYARFGIRMVDLLDEERLIWSATRSLEFNEYFGKYDLDEVLDYLRTYAGYFREFVGDALWTLNELSEKGKRILFEGAQGTLLDIDFGTYPFVTSSHTLSSGIGVGLGFPLRKDVKVLGVFKAYTTRVGKGPFPTEDRGEVGELLRSKGNEYGSTTGRPRRCGWLDLVALKYAVVLNDVDELAITKLDVLFGFKQVKLAVAYRLDGKLIEYPPISHFDMERVEPVYETLEGFSSLDQAKDFLEFIESYLKVPIRMVSYGMSRHETLLL